MRFSAGPSRSIRQWTPWLLGTAALLSVSLTGAGTGDASHYSWLGHSSEVPPNSTSLGTFIPTFYRILNETTWPTGERTEELLTRDGQLMARVTPAFKRQLDIEGSARLRDGRIVNIEDRVGGRMRYLLVRGAPFGVGAPGYRLVPYRTVAVDPRRIKLGTVLYIPALAGISLLSFAKTSSDSVDEGRSSRDSQERQETGDRGRR